MKLKHNLHLYEMLARYSRDIIFFIRPADGQILDFNDAALKHYGYSSEELLSCHIRDLRPSENHSQIQSQMEAAQGAGILFETLHQRKDGTRFPVEVSAINAELDGESIIVSIVRDITGRKAEEEQLLILKSSIDGAPQSAYWLDINGRFIYVNETGCKELGYSIEELSQMHVSEVNVRVTPDRWETTCKTLKEKGKIRIESEHRRKNGTVFPVEISSSYFFYGTKEYINGFALDITERKKWEKDLWESRALLNAIVQSTSDFIWSVDAQEFGLLYFNGSLQDYFLRERGIPIRIGMRPVDLFPAGDYVQNWQAFYRRALAEGPFSTEYIPYTGTHTLQLNFNVLQREGKAFGVSVFGEDITERKRAEGEREHLQNQLVQAQKLEAIGQLAGGVAHDFNNILNAMLMQVGLLQEESRLDPEAGEAMKEFKKDIQRATDLTRQLLLFGRKQLLQFHVLDLNNVTSSLVEMLRRLLRENIDFVLESSSSPIWIEADFVMMEQVVINLCVNAQDAMPDGGRLVLSTHKINVDEIHVGRNPEASTGEFACIKVADQGCGIDAAALMHIFEPFFTTKELGKGTGLGLSTVHGIVRQLNGWVEVESIVGKGSTFKVYIPLSSIEKAPTQPVEDVTSLPKSRKNRTILLVEDESNLRRMTGNVLKRQGHTVIEAADADAALALWQQHGDAIDAVFTDMVMPGKMNGLELGKKLQLLKPGLQVVISSGYSTELLAQTDLQLKGIAYISKPYDVNKLVQTINDLL
jgi:two-component system, cell cycle sensor histidine kinase and response regulator CckA